MLFNLIYFSIGLIFALMVFKNQENFLKLFLFSIIIGPGIKISGYPIVDEYWVIMLLIGLFFRKIMLPNVVNESIEKRSYNLHEKAFILLTIYLLFQSFRGGLWLDDPRMLRWIIFFIIVGLVFFVFRSYQKPIDSNYVAKIIIHSTSIYFLLYFLSGYIYELLTGQSKGGILQDLYISGSSVATFPTVIYSIALIILSQKNKKIDNNLKGINLFIVLSFIIVTITVVYYDSRAGIFAILGALLLNILFQLLQKNNRGILQFFLIICFMASYQFWAANYSNSARKIQDFLPLNSKLEFVVPKQLAQEKGQGRIIIPKVAYNFITEDPFRALFGYGWYMSRYELIDPMRELSKTLKMKLFNNVTSLQAPGAVSVMVDTGFIGIFLYLFNLLLGFSAILKSQNRSKYVVSIIYLTVILWSFVGTITGVLLVYFWVMPKNPILLMLHEKSKKNF